ncbi:hypothetical protein [Kangiella sp. M94]
MNKVVYVLLVVSIILNIYLGLGEQRKEVVAVSSEKVVKEHDNDNYHSYIETINDLEEQNKLLKQELASLKKLSLVAEGAINESAEEEVIEHSETATVERLTPEQEKSFYEEYKEKKASTLQQYKNEGVDPIWSAESESHIAKLISDSNFASEFSLNGVSCKTTMCRISVTPYIENDGAKVAAMMNISQALYTSERFKGYVSTSKHLDDSNAVEIIFYPQTD